MCKQKASMPWGTLGAALAAAAAASALATYLAPALVVVLVVEAVCALLMMGALGWLLRYGGWRRPARPDKRAVNPVTVHAELQRAPYQLPAPPLAIEAPVRVSGVLPGVSATVLPPRARPEGAGAARRARA